MIDFRQVAGESRTAWEGFLNHLYQRGLKGDALKLLIVDGGKGLLAALGQGDAGPRAHLGAGPGREPRRSGSTVRLVLDTNTCIYALKLRGRVVERLREHTPDDFGVTIVTVAELWFGAQKSARPAAARREVDAFLEPYDGGGEP